MEIQVRDVHRDGKRRVALTRDRWRVTGVLRPYVPGQTVEVRFYRGGKRIHREVRSVQPGRRGRGVFQASFKARKTGRISVRAVHRGTPELATVRSNVRRVSVMTPDVGRRGTMLRLLQKGLKKLRYAVPRSGVLDGGTQRAVMAFRKVRGYVRTYAVTRRVVRDVLAGRGAFKVRYPGDGRHVEADLSRQVMALIEGGEVRRIYHISSGSPYTPTVLGRFRVYRKSPGTNALGMVHSTYFIRGYAIHGYHSVPPYNASHGCLRVPIPDAWSIYRWVRMGDIVRVYP